MIDFRYHLVSLIAVFLALAVGVVLGAGPLDDPIGQTVESRADALSTSNNELRQDKAQLYLARFALLAIRQIDDPEAALRLIRDAADDMAG